MYERRKGKDEEEQKRLDSEYSQKLYSEGLNLYGYVKENPVRFSDPNGCRIQNDAFARDVNEGSSESSKTSNQAEDMEKFRKAEQKAKDSSNKTYGGISNYATIETITFKGSEGRVDVKLPNGTLNRSYEGTIKIVEGDFKKNTEQWKNIADFTNKLHYPPPLKDDKYKVDLPGSFNKSQDWFVPDIAGMTIKVTDFTTDHLVHGSHITITLFDKNNKFVAKVTMAHFSVINKAIEDAYKTSTPLEGGIYIGNTGKKIGVSSGPHMHATSNLKRGELFKLFRSSGI